MFGLGAGEILVILIFALIFIGPKKLPELARGLGRGLREFQKAKNELMDEVQRDRPVESQAPPAVISEVAPEGSPEGSGEGISSQDPKQGDPSQGPSSS